MTTDTKKKILIGFVALMVIGGIFGEKPQEEAKKDEVKVAVKKEVIKKEPIAKVAPLKNTLKGGYVACISAELFDQVTTFSVNKDYKGIDYLMKHGCILTKKGIEFSLIDRSFTGTAKIRVYSNDESFILWTNNENLNL